MTTASTADLTIHPRFARAARYHPEWLHQQASGSFNALWLVEWLAEQITFTPGMRVLDLGAGRAGSSIFLQREFGVQVWAVDLWFNVNENQQRIILAKADNDVFPLHADARQLPFCAEFFDVIISVDAFSYFGNDDLYLNYLAQFVKPNGVIAIAGAGLQKEIEGDIPTHLNPVWTQDWWCLHSAQWWQRHWQRTELVSVTIADTLPDGWFWWRQWQQFIAGIDTAEFRSLSADQGQYLTAIRLIARRNPCAVLEPYCWPSTLRSLPAQILEAKPMLKE